MNRLDLVAVGMAIAGFGAIVIGIHQELLHVGPLYEGTIETGWGGSLNHEERLLARVAALGVGGTVAMVRWKYVAVVPIAVGIVELVYPLRAVLHHARHTGLYTEVTMADGTVTRVVLGAEPFLLILGGILTIGACIVGWKSHTTRGDNTAGSTSASSPMQ